MTGQVVQKKAGILKGTLSKFEIISYLIIWIAAIIYSVFSFYEAQNEVYNDYYLDVFNDFSKGWKWIDRKIDVADSEWINGMKIIDLMLPFLFIHLVISEFLKSDVPEFLPLWHATTGSLFILFNVGWVPLIIFCLLTLMFFYFVQFSSKIFIWIPSVLVMMLSHYVFLTMENYDEEFQMHFTAVTLAWINLRCLSYFLDATEEKNFRDFNIRNYMKVLGYCLYLPLLYFGPIINYPEFSSSQWHSKNKKDREPIVSRGKKLLLNIIRFSIWTFVIQLFLHFFYVNAMLYQIEFIRDFNGFSLYGFGYLMGQFFHMKYVVFYGLSTSLTRFELEIPVPPTPKCIARIHLYSEMWKHFDRGLYLFLVKYIYKPIAKTNGKAIGSLITFIFIFMWHGLHPCLLIWSTLNYIGVSIESLCSYIVQSNQFKKSFLNKLSENNKRRFNCILATPLFIMSILSNFYFFSGRNCGDVFVYKFINGSLKFQFVIMCIIYCGSQIATEIQLIENYKKKRSIGFMTEEDLKDKLCSGDHNPNLDERVEERSRGPLRKRYASYSNSPKLLYEKFHKTCVKLNRLGLSQKFDLFKKQSIEKILSNHKLKCVEPPPMDDKNNDIKNEFQQIIDEINTDNLQINFDQISEDMMNEIERKIDELLSIDETKFNEFYST